MTGQAGCLPSDFLGFPYPTSLQLKTSPVGLILLSSLAISQSSFLIHLFSATSLMSVIYPQNCSFCVFLLSTVFMSEFIPSQNFKDYLPAVVCQPCYLQSVSLTRNPGPQEQLSVGYFPQTSCCCHLKLAKSKTELSTSSPHQHPLRAYPPDFSRSRNATTILRIKNRIIPDSDLSPTT